MGVRDEQNPVPAGPTQVELDSAKIRTLAHPLRARLLAALRLDGPATATGLARTLATNTGATSYHLRQLAEVGLVIEEPDRGSTRQRWWRAAHERHRWAPTDFEQDPDDRAASDWLIEFALRALTEQAGRWHAARPGYPRPWRDAASYHDSLLDLTPDQLKGLNAELVEVVERYRTGPGPSRRIETPDRPAGGSATAGQTEQVFFAMYGFPLVRPDAERGGVS